MPFDKKSYDITYQREHQVSLSIRMKPEEKAAIMDAAAAAGMSVRAYILSLLPKA